MKLAQAIAISLILPPSTALAPFSHWLLALHAKVKAYSTFFFNVSKPLQHVQFVYSYAEMRRVGRSVRVRKKSCSAALCEAKWVDFVM